PSRSFATRAKLRSALGILVMAAPPDARLIAALGSAVEPLIHPPESVESTRIGRIGMVDDAILEHERAHARPLARVGGHVGSGHRRVIADRIARHAGRHPLVVAYRQRRLAPVVVFDAALALL